MYSFSSQSEESYESLIAFYHFAQFVRRNRQTSCIQTGNPLQHFKYFIVLQFAGIKRL